jgi:DNA-directed RNA polymerase subunit RPC12/RpoP
MSDAPDPDDRDSILEDLDLSLPTDGDEGDAVEVAEGDAIDATATATVTDGGDETYHCDSCGRVVAREDATRGETMGGLDPETWQTLMCPHCGTRLKTVFVGLD